MRINVMRAAEVKDLAELGVSDKICQKLEKVPVEEIIQTARIDGHSWKRESKEQMINSTSVKCLLRYPGIGSIGATQIYEALDKAGLLYHDPHAGLRELLRGIGVLERPQTNEEYENQIVITGEMEKQMLDIITTVLTQRRAGIVKLRFGLDGKLPHTFAKIAPLYGVVISMIQAELNEAKRDLRRHQAKTNAFAKILGIF